MHQAREIEDLIGEELNAVCFVMDYVEFHFNGPILRALSNPRVRSRNGEASFPEPESRDQLCALIGRVVEQVTVLEEQQITVSMSGELQLVIPLDAEHRVGPEAAHFVVGQGKDLRMSIW